MGAAVGFPWSNGFDYDLDSVQYAPADCQVAGTIMDVNELLEYELKQSELLDATIERKITSLFKLKTMEQMLSRT